MCYVTRDLQTPPFCKLSNFLRLFPPQEREVGPTLCTVVKHL